MCLSTSSPKHHRPHQRAPPKTHGQQVEKLDAVLKQLQDDLAEAKKEYKAAKNDVRFFFFPHRLMCVFDVYFCFVWIALVLWLEMPIFSILFYFSLLFFF